MRAPAVWCVHVFVCTNEREPEAVRVSCGRQCDAMGHIAYLKESIKQRNLHLDIRAQKAGCMEVCEQGPTVAVYPQGWFFRIADLSSCSILVDVLASIAQGSLGHIEDLPPSARALYIEPQSVAHVRARALRRPV